MHPRDGAHPLCHRRTAQARQAAVADKGAEQQAIGRQQRAQPHQRTGNVVHGVETAGPDDQIILAERQVDRIDLTDDRPRRRGEPRSGLEEVERPPACAQRVGKRGIVGADQQDAIEVARDHFQPVEQRFGQDRRQEIGISGQARQPVALGAVAGGGKERRRLRHGRACAAGRDVSQEADGDDGRRQRG